MQTFRTDVESTILRTRTLISVAWDDFVQCEVDHPCCDVPVEIWNNVNTEIVTIDKQITEKQTQLQQVEVEITKMKNMCVDQVDFDAITAQLDANANMEVEVVVQEDNDSVQA